MSKEPKSGESKEVATLDPSQLPAGLAEDLGQYAGAGVSTRSEDFQMPFLAIAQANSPQLKKQQADKYIKGLEVGFIFNTATGDFWDGSEGLLVVQSWFQKAMVEWVPRRRGGGWVATHPIDTPLLKTARWGGQDRRELLTPDDTQLVDTSYHFVHEAETGDPLVISMTSTGLGTSRQWQTIMKRVKIPFNGEMVIAPCFSRVYRIGTVYRQNDAGDWFNWSVKDEGWAAGNPTYRAGYEAAKQHFIYASEHGVQMGKPPVDDVDNGPVVDGDADTPI